MRLVLTILSLVVCCAVEAQYKGPKLPIKDDWFWNYGAKGLQVGDVMPDIPLGTVINNSSGKTRFSQFRGKLVILDFWNTRCTNCIAGFAKMEKLQMEFGDQIQVILVNLWETEEEIREGMQQKHLMQYQLPVSIPCIVSGNRYKNVSEFEKDTPLIARFFPMKGVPQHVWIDRSGIIQLRGGAENTYTGKIKELLLGKSIQVLENYTTLPDLFTDKKALYYQQLGYMQQTPVSYGSFITPYTYEVTGPYGGIGEKVDSARATRITTYINQCLLDLYLRCFRNDKDFRKAFAGFLFSPSKFTALDFLQFPPGTDTLLYSSDPSVIKRELTTEEIIRSRYCYEQIVPQSIPEEERRQIMLEDLNRYFKTHYGITGAVEKRKVTYYELIRTTDQNNLTISTPELQFQAKVIKHDGKLILDYQGPISEFFTTWLRNKQVSVSKGLLFDSTGHPFLIYNGTGWDRKQLISIKIPLTDLQTITDLRHLLQGYGLDLVKRYEELPFYVFTRVKK